MAEQLKPIGVKLDDTVGAIVTCGSSEKREVLWLNFDNTNSTAETIEVWYVPNDSGSVGVAATDGFRIVSYDIPAGKNLIWDKPITLLAENDTIQAFSTTANEVHCIGAYVEVTG